MEAASGSGRLRSEPHPRAAHQPQIVAAVPPDSAGCAKLEGRWPGIDIDPGPQAGPGPIDRSGGEPHRAAAFGEAGDQVRAAIGDGADMERFHARADHCSAKLEAGGDRQAGAGIEPMRVAAIDRQRQGRAAFLGAIRSRPPTA